MAVGAVSFGTSRNLYVLRTDAQGFKLWDYVHSSSQSETALDIVLAKDGGYFITGIIDTFGFTAKCFALKLDANGSLQWYKTYRNFFIGALVKSVETPDNNFLIIRQPPSGMPSILVLNAQGDSINNVTYSDAQPGQRIYRDIILNADSSYSITGAKSVNGINRLWLLRLDERLDTIWSRVYGDSIPGTSNQGRSVIQTADKGFAIAGRWGVYNGVLVKTDSLGNIRNTSVTGSIVNDLNGNCAQDTGEDAMRNKTVKLTSSTGNHYYGYTNNQGKYKITAYELGPAVITWQSPGPYWQRTACQPLDTTVNLLFYDTTTVDLFAQPTINCPRLNVSVSNFRLRRCFADNQFTVSYCNLGTVTADNAYVEVTFDQFLEVSQSTLPWTSVSGETYTFDLGNIAVGACGSFVVTATVNCDSTVIGQAHCVEAHIYPDSICEPVEPTWDFSSLTLVSQCQESDSIKFTITNVGTGNMSSPSSYTLIENTTIVAQTTFQLNAGESIEILLPGNGSTYTLTVPQSMGHPGSSAPLRALEGCGKDDNGDFSIGFLMNFPQDDENEFIDILCKPNRGAYDPNAKITEPLGVGADGFINATQQLEYTIQFQNTGTDTAYTVVLKDTLPQYLDITSLLLTGATHNYTFEIIDSNVLVWTFDNILLPDSNVNEPLSHGLVSFTINQKDNNTPGTIILNRAGIYFDFNEPIITNYTINTVVEDYKTELETSVSIEELSGKLDALKLYPNPNTGQFYIELLQPVEGELSIAIFDLAGKQVAQNAFAGQGPHLVDVQTLETGMYFYTLMQGNETIGNGKLVVEQR